MKRPIGGRICARPKRAQTRRAYTLVEVLTAVLLTLILMLAVVSIFGAVGQGVNDVKATLEMTDELRAAEHQLQRDLDGLTVKVLPPRRPEAGDGVLEIIEGRLGPAVPVWTVARDEDSGNPDTTAGDFDDILLVTTHSRGAPFIGRFGPTTIESQDAEIIWFVRGRTLYRRVLLIAPQVRSQLDSNGNGVIEPSELGNQSFFNVCDVSARPAFDNAGNLTGWVPNTLGDLAKRENRFAHRVLGSDGFPYDARLWGQLALPTLCEMSHPNWMVGWSSRPQVTPLLQIDLWNTPHPWVDATGNPEVDRITGTLVGYDGPRIGQDAILTNVIAFDVKVWDPDAPVLRAVNDNGTPLNLTDDTSIASVTVLPGDAGYPLALAHCIEELGKQPANRNPAFLPITTGAYVDLNYAAYARSTYTVGSYSSLLSGPGQARSGLRQPTWGGVYDTWSLHYENNGIDEDGRLGVDQGTNGFDDDGNGIVDDPGEWETVPPYPVPLRGIQIEIRVFEPDSRQVRKVTVVQDFLPK